MSDANNLSKRMRSEAGLAQMIVRIAEVAQADVIICATETGEFARQLQRLSDQIRIIAATSNADTYILLTQTGMEVIRLPLLTADKYKQVCHIISVAFKSAKVSLGDLIVCALAHDLYSDEGNFAVLTNVEPYIEYLTVADLVKLTDGIRPTVLETAIMVACKIGRAARRGRRIGTIFVLGDSLKVLEGSTEAD